MVIFINMKGWNPKDIIMLILVLTVSVVLVSSTISSVFLGRDATGKTEEIIAFLLGSMVTIIGEYVLINIKERFRNDDKD